MECWHVHRRCFAWSVSLGSLIILLGLGCLLFGFLVPRHPVLVGQMEENDLKMWIAAHSPSSPSHFNLGDATVTSLNILDRKVSFTIIPAFLNMMRKRCKCIIFQGFVIVISTWILHVPCLISQSFDYTTYRGVTYYHKLLFKSYLMINFNFFFWW